MSNGIAIVWSDNSDRCKELAELLNFEIFTLRGAKSVNKIFKIFRYFSNTFQTVIKLVTDRNLSYCLIQIPPWVLLWIICLLKPRVTLIVDSHPSAFGHFDNWFSKKLLQITPKKWLRKPKIYLVANKQDQTQVLEFGSKAIIFGEALYKPLGMRQENNHSVLIPWNLSKDDPVDEIIEFFQTYKGNLKIRITGNHNEQLRKKFNLNPKIEVTFLGYLPQHAFRQEMLDSSVVFAVSKSEQTRMRVAIEATLCKVPVITCTNENMLDELPNAIHIESNLASLSEALKEALTKTTEELDSYCMSLIEKNHDRTKLLLMTLEKDYK